MLHSVTTRERKDCGSRGSSQKRLKVLPSESQMIAHTRVEFSMLLGLLNQIGIKLDAARFEDGDGG
jgi:hypothetical protein